MYEIVAFDENGWIVQRAVVQSADFAAHVGNAFFSLHDDVVEVVTNVR